jgi:Fanconi anemia group M protein
MAYTPGPVPLCPDTASDWVFPIHQEYPVRDYQLEMSETAVLCNTLVSLPTGLGKTLIASVVLYNFYRWFPTGKVIFLAPTLPLVNQQVKACYDIMGIPAADTALLTGKVAAKDRQNLWNERRVFFCTPQTVQRDIDSGRCPAKRVVCVVFDEAHKASGSYAYTQVVEQLEAAGARYRILGLSATPGTGIKQIQEVVTVLRIQKVEARLEDDPSVKKYVHERHSEIITVQQGSAVTNIERMLNDLIAPLLERLRNSNGLAMIRGNATLTPWCIIRARQEYQARMQDHSLDSYFHAAHSLIMIRSEIRKTGIGMVRSKMIQLKNEPKGIMVSIVKGKEFQAIWEAVLRASSDPKNVNEPAQDRKLNNPKLLKLDEILTEHFERARACGKSSRAIVFSQWRESVSEIVSVLSSKPPLLRPRHFVGQGKSTGGVNKQNVDQSCVSLKGMKQKEQQRVIKEFREGKFNILGKFF